jgi:CHAD domain-containing protein
MGTLITSAEKSRIEELAEQASSSAIRRRAQLLLLYDQGLETKEVAEQVDLSPGRTRYWRRRYLFDGMDIFAGSSVENSSTKSAPKSEDTPGLQLLPEKVQAVAVLDSEQIAEIEPDTEQEPVSLAELQQRYPANLRQAEHRRDLALELFDGTQSIHHLPGEMRRLLEVSALLEHLTESREDGSPNKSGYLFILSHPLTDLDEEQNKLVQTVLASLHGKSVFPRSPDDREQILSPSQHEALTLAAFLRIAHGLDFSQTQETKINSIEIQPKKITVFVKGPHARFDARKAKKSGKLWPRLYGQKIRFQAVYQLESDQDDRLEALITRKNPGITPGDDFAEAGRKVLGYHFAQMLLHESGTRAGYDIEELHDMRVATRRMRAAFEVFAEAYDRKAIKVHLKGLRATGRALGAVRDLDVFMEKAQQYLDSLPQEERTGLDPLLNLWQDKRRTDRAQMLQYLDSQDYADFKRKFTRFVTTPGAGVKNTTETRPHEVRYIAPILVYTRLGAVRTYGPLLESATIDQLHALRIEFKKLRYTLEFFSEVLGEENKELINGIKQLQDHLGDLNDADVACSILSQFIDNWEARQMHLPIAERENPEPVVAYLASKHAERYFLTTTFQEAWKEFDQPEVRCNLALAVSVL